MAYQTEANAAVSGLNDVIEDAINTLTTAVEAAETVVAKYGMTFVRNKVPRFELRKADDSY